MLYESSRARPQAPHASRWVLALTILLGQVTMAFSMFAVAVALPSIMNALNGDVTTIHWVMTGFPAPGVFSTDKKKAHRRPLSPREDAELEALNGALTLINVWSMLAAYGTPSITLYRSFSG